jgi:hypothetical protein
MYDNEVIISKRHATQKTQKIHINEFFFFLKALTVLRRPLAYPNGLLDLHIETLGRTPWLGDQPDARPLPTPDNTTQKHTHTSMPQAGFEPAIPMFEQS